LLYKRALVLAPGRFDNVSDLHADLIENTLAQLPAEEIKESKGGLGLFCLSVEGSKPSEKGEPLKEIVEHVENLRELGYGVMLFPAREIYKMSAFANRYTKSRIHFAIGLTVLVRIFEDSYNQLEGALLEAVARIFTQNVRVSVYPMTVADLEQRVKAAGLTGWSWKETGGVVTADNLRPGEPVNSLYQYLLGSGFILAAKP